jgi:hypothetical protein
MHRPAVVNIVRALALAALAAPALGERVTIFADRDNTLFGNETNSSGSGPFVRSGRTGGGGGGLLQRGLVRFDCTSVPAGAKITGAELTLVLVSSGGLEEPSVLTLHRVLADWGEGASAGSGGLGSPAQPGDATWLHTFFPGELWATPGGDYAPGGSGQQSVGTEPGPVTWSTSPGLVADVQAWVDAPATNFGWIVIGNETDFNSAKKFASRENPLCPADITSTGGVGSTDGNVDALDLLAMLARWGDCPAGPACPADLTGPAKGPDGIVDGLDLAVLLEQWGSPGHCPADSSAPRLTITYTAP